MYGKQKTKSSLGIIPDENSATQHLKRSCYQTCIWHQCTKQRIDYPPLNETWGWKDEEHGIVPVWYTCSQFPPTKTQTVVDSSDEGTEAEHVIDRSATYDNRATSDREYECDDDG